MSDKTESREVIFAREWVIDRNGTRAAIAAGYSENSAHVTASRMLKKAKVQRLIDGLLTRRASKLDLKAERVLEELQRLAFTNMADYMEIDADGKPLGLDLSKITRDQAAAIQEIREDSHGGAGDGERRLVIRRTFKLADKLKSLELLCRNLGLFNDKLHVTGVDNLAEKMNQIRVRKNGDASAAA